MISEVYLKNDRMSQSPVEKISTTAIIIYNDMSMLETRKEIIRTELRKE